ncbi:NAD(P)-binding domain-containing protein [Cynara cardunculus var. scolymus]|uniref:NAD(P)-binding domain-containing protein n=1 Tax=Cynara cardunculus var. scolymus TaxID=59895 RepID=A0A124SEV2_CYNCS|nr:NAD(P)-binding domain-containing protein [Cynara cardunculus var. scolymus]
MKNNRIRRRVFELLSKASSSAAPHPSSGQRELHFTFFRKPDKFLESDDRSGHVAGLQFEKTTLQGRDGSGNQIAAGTGQHEDLKCGLVKLKFAFYRLVLKSIGYTSIPVEDLPFNFPKGTVPNTEGRVLSSDFAKPDYGLYVCGWLKRGPTGIIATNLYDAEETVASISEDLEKGKLTSASIKPGREGLLQLLERRKVQVVTFSDWEKIDSEEKRLGSLKGKPREKLTTWKDLLEVTTK